MKYLYVLRWWIWFLSEVFIPRDSIRWWWDLEPRWKGKRRWM